MTKDPLSGIARISSLLAKGGYSARLHAYSAIDRYLGFHDMPILWLETNADIAALARLIENLRFPGVDLADGAADTPEGTCYFRCLEKNDQRTFTFPLLSFYCDLQRGHFGDPLGVYPVLKNLREKRSPAYNHDEFSLGKVQSEAGRYRVIMDAALLLARYGFDRGQISSELGETLENYPPEPPPSQETQRAFLNCLLVSPQPDEGLAFLKSSGFLKELWPELSCLDEVDHSKEYHPEGNVWDHTLETFRYRKALASGAFDLRLSLGLLLHDVGKPISASFGSRRFDGHAELGARTAKHFLKRLEYEGALADDIFFLVKNHMLPAALKRLPLIKTREIMTSPLFPVLMELYRCDESSSFKVLDNYYENSAAYQTYLRNQRNPYRRNPRCSLA